MQTNGRTIGTAAILLSMLLVTGCTGMNDTEQRMLSGGAIGAGTGALVGAVTGGLGIATGAAIGAAAGAAGGYIVDQVAE
jgi:hypothetical protein